MAESELHSRLVQHLAEAMRSASFSDVEIHGDGRQPEKVFRHAWSLGGHIPDVVGREGRRTVYGDAKLGASDVRRSFPQLEVFAKHGRELMICVPQTEIHGTADMLADEWKRHYRRLRLVGSESPRIFTVRELL